MTFNEHNNIIVFMIPPLITLSGALWPLLPPGIYDSTLDEIFDRYAVNDRRKFLFEGLDRGLRHLFSIGCRQVFLDGSYVTEKPLPNDYEVCWDMAYVDGDKIDPVFLDFSNGRRSQKEKYGGEYFPASIIEQNSGKPFLDFFQTDKESGKQKGIIRISHYLSKKGG